jgi:hypothetical protein
MAINKKKIDGTNSQSEWTIRLQ